MDLSTSIRKVFSNLEKSNGYFAYSYSGIRSIERNLVDDLASESIFLKVPIRTCWTGRVFFQPFFTLLFGGNVYCKLVQCAHDIITILKLSV